MEIKTVKIKKPDEANIIIGQTHFIKSAEDLYEAMLNSVPGVKFGLAFCEASGPCLIRSEGNDRELKTLAEENCANIGAGHAFLIMMKDAYPVNVLQRIREAAEVCSIFCATANPVEVIVCQTEQGRGILGVIDGSSPKGLEKQGDVNERRKLLRKFGYKL